MALQISRGSRAGTTVQAGSNDMRIILWSVTTNVAGMMLQAGSSDVRILPWPVNKNGAGMMLEAGRNDMRIRPRRCRTNSVSNGRTFCRKGGFTTPHLPLYYSKGGGLNVEQSQEAVPVQASHSWHYAGADRSGQQSWDRSTWSQQESNATWVSNAKEVVVDPWAEWTGPSVESQSSIPRVLVVAEKPTIAKRLQNAMQECGFLGFARVQWIFASTYGHITDVCFRGSLPTVQDGLDHYAVQQQASLFFQPLETFHKSRQWTKSFGYSVEETIAWEGTGVDFVVLALDNDFEGESIADEVECILSGHLAEPRFDIQHQIWRCRFSSLDQDSLQRSMNLPPKGTLGTINSDFVASVRVRRELDLRLDLLSLGL